jgi:uncharacterized protein YdhG (YjbR/CyaY superfamily)
MIKKEIQPKPKDVTEYIAGFPSEARDRMKKLRALIKEVAPDAEELISYGMPGYKLYNKPLVYFAAYKNHIGLYATPTGHEVFEKELSPYKQGKGSVQFPLNEPFPLELIRLIVEFRIKENRSKTNT